MRFLTLCLLLTACDETPDALVVPDDNGIDECVLTFKQETGDCEESGFGYWTPPPKSVYTVYRCTGDGVCIQSGVTLTNGVGQFTCSEYGRADDYFIAEYITP